jgi:hypothetical protein
MRESRIAFFVLIFSAKDRSHSGASQILSTPRPWNPTLEKRRVGHPSSLVRDAYDQSASAGKFGVGDLRDEGNVEAQACGFLKCDFVEEVDYVSSELIFQAAALIEIERAGRIDFQVSHLANDRAQRALELQRAGPYLRHRESYDVIGHEF